MAGGVSNLEVLLRGIGAGPRVEGDEANRARRLPVLGRHLQQGALVTLGSVGMLGRSVESKHGSTYSSWNQGNTSYARNRRYSSLGFVSMGRPLTKSVRTLKREELIGLNVDFDDESKKEEREIFWRWWWTEEWFATENEVEPVGTCVTDFLSYNAEQLVQRRTTSTISYN